MSIGKSTLIMLLFITFSYGQQLEREVIGSAGETLSNGSVMLNYTVGETIVGDISNGTISLSQGFHNGYISLGIKINPVVFLQGAAIARSMASGEENLMRDDLRLLYLPTTSPYSDALTCSISVFNTGGASGTGLVQDDIVDWVWIELRDETNNELVKGSRSALLQRDGDVVDVDGVSNVQIEISSGNYYVAVKHRNHLSVMTANTFALSETVAIVDFTDANNQITWGSNAQSTFGMPSGIVAMWAGNTNEDVNTVYLGSSNDSNIVKDQVLAHSGNTSNSNLYSFNDYTAADVNLNGLIKYQGSGNDTNIIKDIVLSHPDNTGSSPNLYKVKEQLPENN